MCSRSTHRHVTGFVAAAVLLLLLVLPDPPESDLDTHSPRQLELEPGSDPDCHSMSLSKFSQCFTQFVCCNCYEHPDRVQTTFFGTRRAAALHVSRSAMCRAAGKGVKTVTQEYRPSKRVEDQEAGPVGGAGTWPVRPAEPGISYPISTKPLISKQNLRSPYIPILYRYPVRHQSFDLRSPYIPILQYDIVSDIDVKLRYRTNIV